MPLNDNLFLSCKIKDREIGVLLLYNVSQKKTNISNFENDGIKTATTGKEVQEGERVEEGPFVQPWEDSDVIIVAKEKEIHVHKIILCFGSPVFKRMFNSDFKESREGKVEIKEKKYEDILIALKMLYPQHEVDLRSLSNVEEITGILNFAKEYMMESVTKKVEDFLLLYLSEIQEHSSSKIYLTVEQILKIADEYDLSSVVDKSARMIGSSRKGIPSGYTSKTMIKLRAFSALSTLEELEKHNHLVKEEFEKVCKNYDSGLTSPTKKQYMSYWDTHDMPSDFEFDILKNELGDKIRNIISQSK